MAKEKKDSELDLPSLELEKIQKTAVEIKRKAAKIRPWIKEELQKIQQIKTAGRTAQELSETQIEETKQKINEYLNNEIPAYRRAAWLGLLEFEFSQELNSKTEVWQLIKRLIAEKRLVECGVNGQGPLKVGNQTYTVSSESKFDQPELEEVAKMLQDLIQRVSEKTKTKIETLRKKGSSDLRLLFSFNSGLYVINVPPEKTTEGRWRPGGVFLINSDGKKIYPLEGAGGIEEVIKKLNEENIFLKISTLQWEKPPVIKDAEELTKKVQLLWHLIRRAIKNNNSPERKEN